jgi:hypothetical protein
MNVACVGRKMNENNVIELWIVGIEYVMIMVVYEYLLYKVSLGYVSLALVCCFPCGYVALRAVLKVSLGYVVLALVYFFCPASMWHYGLCCER